MKNLYRFLAVAVVVMFSFMLMTSQAFAASKTTYLYDGQMSISDDAGTGTGDISKYTLTAKGSLISKKTNKITITNETDTDAEISFTYSVSSANSFTIAGATVSTSGDYSAIVGGGDSIAIALQSNSGFSDTTATLTLTNITYTHMAKSSEITFDFDSSLGIITAGGETISSGSTITIGEEGVNVIATPASGAKFVAWIDENNKIISRDSSYTQNSIGNITLKALFSKNTPYFMVDSTHIFSDLNNAAAKGHNLVLICDGILPEGNYTIPATVSLLIPFDDKNTMYTTVAGHNEDISSFSIPNEAAPYITPTAYRTLTMESGAKIIVNGAISVSAKQASMQGYTGYPNDKYGHIAMKDGSSITVNSGGKLYVWGYITGQGTITAESDATVYECFQIADWRGGSAISDMIDNEQKVFPMSQYYVQNIEVPLTLKSGATENGYTSAFATAVGTQGCDIPFIGPNGMFKIENGFITKDYDEENDRLVISVNGTLNMEKITLKMTLGLSNEQTITSENYILPINGNITLNAMSGSKVNISQDIALLPGGEIKVEKDAECILASGVNVIIYDNYNWGNYCYTRGSVNGGVKYVPLKYAPGRINPRTEAALKDAKVYVEGIVDASNGYVYVTEPGANICGGDGGVVKFNQVADDVTYQATQSGRTITYVSIPITTAKIKIDDENYFEHDGLHTEFVNSNGAWEPKHNTVSYGAKATTCEEIGWNAYEECSVCDYSTYQEIAALGHNYVDFNCSVCGCEKIATDTTYTIDGEEIIINTSLILDVPANTQIIIATYDSLGTLLNTSLNTIDLPEKIILPSTGVTMIKVFAWDGFSTLSPISCVEKINVL